MRPATLRGYARVQFRSTPYPTLLPRPGSRVEGALIRPAPAALALLQRCEDACYRLSPVRVQVRHGLRWARAWMVPRRLAARVDWPLIRA